MTAPWKMPGTGPVRVDTLPRVIDVAVTPTSVAPPLPPAGAEASGFEELAGPLEVPAPVGPARPVALAESAATPAPVDVAAGRPVLPAMLAPDAVAPPASVPAAAVAP